MTSYNKAEIMKRAWELRRKRYFKTFAACLSHAWGEAQEKVAKERASAEDKIVAYLLSNGFSIWEGGKNRRIYINDISKFTSLSSYGDCNYCKLYYDLSAKSFIELANSKRRRELCHEAADFILSEANAI